MKWHGRTTRLISVFYNRKFKKKNREIAGFIPNPLRFHEKNFCEAEFVKTGAGKNRGSPKHCVMAKADDYIILICFLIGILIKILDEFRDNSKTGFKDQCNIPPRKSSGSCML